MKDKKKIKKFWMRHDGMDLYTARPIKSKILAPLQGSPEDLEKWHEVTIIYKKHRESRQRHICLGWVDNLTE